MGAAIPVGIMGNQGQVIGRDREVIDVLVDLILLGPGRPARCPILLWFLLGGRNSTP